MKYFVLTAMSLAALTAAAPALAGKPGFAACTAMVPKLNRVAHAHAVMVDSEGTDALALQFVQVVRAGASAGDELRVNADCRWYAKAKDAEKWRASVVKGAEAKSWNPVGTIFNPK